MSSSHPPQPRPSSPAPYPPSCTRRRSPGHLPQLLPPALASCPRQSVRETCESSFQLPLSPKPRPRLRPTWHRSGGPGDTRPPEAALTLPDVHGSFRNSFTELIVSLHRCVLFNRTGTWHVGTRLAMAADRFGCRSGRGCCQHLVGTGQGCCSTPRNAQDSPWQRTACPRTSREPSGNPAWEELKVVP